MPAADGDHTLHEMMDALRGDSDSLGHVLERYRVRLAAAVIAAGAYRNVDDIVQEALLKIMKAVRAGKLQLGSIEQFRGWAHTIAHNCALDALRQQQRQPRHLTSVFGSGDGSALAPAERIGGREPSPSLNASSREELDEIRRRYAARLEAIADLRQPDQMLVWMRERDDMTFAAIARELGDCLGKQLTEDAMRMRYTRLVMSALVQRSGHRRKNCPRRRRSEGLASANGRVLADPRQRGERGGLCAAELGHDRWAENKSGS